MIQNPQLQVGLTGHFSLDIYNPETDETRHYEFDNIITNGGLDRLGSAGSGAVISHVQVGTGSAAPAVTDSALANYLAGTNRISGGGTGPTYSASYAGSPSYHTEATFTWEFNQGAAAGNLTEVGVGWASSGSLFSRALILDGGGNPTTITVTAIEFLTVTYKLRMYPPTTDVTGTIALDGTDYDYIIRAREVGGEAWVSHGRVGYSAGVLSEVTVRTGGIGTITGFPFGTAAAISGTVSAYSSSSYKRTLTFTASISQGNLSGGIRSLVFGISASHNAPNSQMQWQCQFDPKIPKDNTKTLSLTFDVSWARKT